MARTTKPLGIVDLQMEIENLKSSNQICLDKIKSLNEQINQKFTSKLQKMQKEMDLHGKKMDQLKDRVEYIEQTSVSKTEFKRMQETIQFAREVKSQLDKLNASRISQRHKTEQDLHRVKLSTKQQGSNVDKLHHQQKQLGGSVTSLKQTVSLLDENAKKAFNELDTLYDQDHRTQKQLGELETRVEKIVEVLHREEADNDNKLSLKLEMVEREVTKLFKFMCLIIFAMGLVTFWCVWWQFKRKPIHHHYRPHQL